MTTIGNGLFDVEQRLRSSPELVNVPKILEDVASLGSKVNDYVTTTDQLKQTTQNLEKAQHIIESNITALKVRTNNLFLFLFLSDVLSWSNRKG